MEWRTREFPPPPDRTDPFRRVKNNDPKFVALDLRFQKMGDAHLQAWATGALKGNTSVKSVSLGGNDITPEGARALVEEGLADNDTITFVELNNNKIGDEGMVLFGNLLKTNKGLKMLRFNKNFITDVGAQALVEGLAKNNSVEYISLEGNHIGVAGAKLFAALFEARTARLCINLINNPIGQEGQQCIIQGIRDNYVRRSSFSFYCDHRSPLLQQLTLDYYLELNKSGRYLLREHNVPSALWASVMGTRTVNRDPSLLYYFVHANPNLFDRNHHSNQNEDDDNPSDSEKGSDDDNPSDSEKGSDDDNAGDSEKGSDDDNAVDSEKGSDDDNAGDSEKAGDDDGSPAAAAQPAEGSS